MDCSQRRRGLEPLFLASCMFAGCRSTPLVVVTGVGQIDPIDFGRVIVGETSTLPLKIENIQGSAFRLSAAPSIGGVDGSDFQLVEPPPLNVAQGGSVTGLLAFSPQDGGPRSGLIGASTDSSAAAVLSGTVTGVGVAPDSITLTASPRALNFGQVEILVSEAADAAGDQHRDGSPPRCGHSKSREQAKAPTPSPWRASSPAPRSRSPPAHP